MSRWTSGFERHRFQSPWKAIIDLSQTLTVPDETVVTDVEELARLKKIITYLNELIKALDPEVAPGGLFNSFADQADQCLGEMNAYNSNKSISHLNNANGNLDNMLSYVRPYVVSDKAAAQAATTAFKAYSDTVNEQIGLLKSKAKDAVTKTEQNQIKSDALIADIDKSKTNIQELEAELLKGTETEKSLKDRLSMLFQEVTSWYTQIGDFHKKLTAGNEQESAIVLQIDNARKKAVEDSGLAEDAKESVDELLKELGKFYVTIFGKENESGGREGGLKQELEVRGEELEESKKKHQESYKTMYEKIESLLPGATSAGLASSYKKMKDSFTWSIVSYTALFCFSLLVIVLSGFVVLTDTSPFVKFLEFKDFANHENLFASALYKMPIFGSLLWLAFFASARRSEARRLQQEYAHKEALASSYQSFKFQIDALGSDVDKDEKLLQKLLDTAIVSTGFNPSETLDGKHGDKMPILNLSEKSLDKLLKGIERMPDILKACRK